MNDRVRLTIEDGIADVRLNRADKINALDPEMFRAVAETGGRLRENAAVRVVVISGNGRAFCAGLDVERIIAATEGRSILPFADLTKRTHGLANFAQHIIWLWRELPVPVIAAVHGVAFGGGFQLALGADLRYVAPGTKLSIIEAKWGLVPDMAGTQLMRHLAREDIVRELTYTGRIFSADEALAYGFATRVEADPLAAAMATRAIKRLLNEAVACDAAAGLAMETEEQRRLLATPNQIEAVKANLENRAPRFVNASL